MLVQMRTTVAKVITFALFGLLILSFAVWGIGDIFRTGGQVAAVAEVGDARITTQEFSRSVNREMSRLRQRFGGSFEIEQARAFGIVDQVLDQLIDRAAFAQQAADMGLIVSDDLIKRHIAAEPAFQDEFGDFDRARFFQVLNNVGLSEQQYIRDLSLDISRAQLIDAVSSNVTAPRALAEALYRYQQEARVAETISVSFDSVGELPEPSEEDLAATHETHGDRFQSPEYRAVTVISLKAENLAKEVSFTEDALREAFDQRREDFRVPERRALRQIVLADEAQAREAESKLAEGQDLAAVAQDLLGFDPVDLGKVSEAELADQLPEVAAAAFALAEGAVSKPVESPLGWHILQVTAIEPGEEPSFEKVRDLLAEDLAMNAAVDSMVSIANELDDELGSGATLEEAAEILGLELRKIPAIDAGGKDPDGETIDGLPPVGEFIPVVFQSQPGEDSLLNETRDGDYFVVRVDSVTPAVIRPLEEVREDVVELWRELERDRLTRERAEALAERAKGDADLAAIAEAEGLTLETTDPITRAGSADVDPDLRDLAGKIFDMNLGETVTASTSDGYLVAKLTQVQEADLSADREAVDGLQEDVGAALAGDLRLGFIASLRDDLGVSINQAAIDDSLSYP